LQPPAPPTPPPPPSIPPESRDGVAAAVYGPVVKARLRDPDSTVFTHIFAVCDRKLGKQRVEAVCGDFRSKNGFGGYEQGGFVILPKLLARFCFTCMPSIIPDAKCSDLEEHSRFKCISWKAWKRGVDDGTYEKED
jgi:hypothetical protein